MSRLLPAWALPGAAATPVSNDDTTRGSGEGSDGDGSGGPAAPQDTPASASSEMLNASVPAASVAGSIKHPWRSAKRSLGTALQGVDGQRDYRRAARAYVRARGGAQRAAHSATFARGATARLAAFLSDVSTGGLASAAQQLGLASLTGRPVHDVLAAITNALAPHGATLPEAAARQSVADTLASLWEARDLAEGGFDRLQAMTADDVRGAITDCVSSYIFYQWALELGRAIERRAVSTNDAITMEREMRQYIRDTLTLDLASIDVLGVDWAGSQGQAIISKVYAEAFALIEAV